MMENSQYVWLTLPVLMFFLATAFPTLASIVSNRTDKKMQGEVLGVYYSIQGCAMGLSPMFVGSLVGAYPSLTGWGSAFMMVIACLIFLKARKKKEFHLDVE
jgi:MFS family permease